MKGYYTTYGYVGFIFGKKMLFATEEEYIECYKNCIEKGEKNND